MAAGSAQRKVLLSGDVDGRFAALFSRVASVNKSNGPFDLLLCTGRFLPQDEAAADRSLEELRPYLTGAKPVPVPTYFLGAAGPAAPRLLQLLEQPEATAEVHYLGRAGLRQLKGLAVAFLDLEHEQADVGALEASLRQAEGDVDFLLTCEWPDRVTALCAPGAVPEGLAAGGSQTIARLALAARPRYHVAACKGTFFARVPYLNKDLGAGSHVTRFIGLAAVGNAAKQKSLHALGLQPAAAMDAAALQQTPAGSTPCPYSLPAQKRTAEEGLGGQDWRWQGAAKRQRAQAEPSWGRPDVVKDARKTVYVRNLPFAATEADITAFFSACGPVADLHRGATDGKLHGWGFVQFESVEAAERAAELSGAELMGRELFIEAAGRQGAAKPTGDPVQGCWFCLSSADADLSLIVSVGEEVYVALDKGPINPHHVLLLPIEHQPNSLELSPAAHAELERYLSALRSAYASKGQLMLAFERYMTLKSKGGNHMQFNVLPVPAAAAKTAQAVCLELAQQHGVPLRAVPGPVKGEGAREALREAAGTGEYFLLVLPDGSRLVHAVGKGQRHPVAFGRAVAARLAGAPDRADWKVCKGDEAQEQRMTAAFKEFFKPYDIMS